MLQQLDLIHPLARLTILRSRAAVIPSAIVYEVSRRQA